MSTFMSAYLQSFDDDDTANNDAADKRQAQLFDDKLHPDQDEDTTLILDDNTDYEQLAALRKLLNKDDE